MNYIEYKVSEISEEQSEIVIAELADTGFESFSEYDPISQSLDCYILKTQEQNDLINTLLVGYKFIRTEIEQQNWNQLWESNFEPIQVGDKCHIRATFHAPHRCDHEIVITPKMSFGTGHHPTTHLVVELMLEERFDNMKGLDMGSGTGILAILAAQRGAEAVDAIDIDEWAYENCAENVELNGKKSVVRSILGDASAVGKSYDFVLANINRNILLRDMPIYVRAMNDNALLIVSGILEMDIKAITDKAEELGLRLEKRRLREGWAALKFSR